MTAPHLGAHMSIAGGMPRAIERARAVAATALQVFVKSSNQWAARPFASGEVEEYRRASEEAGLAPFTLAHASYLINLASPDDGLWAKSTAALTGELTRCEELGIPWLVVHPGSHVGSGVSAGVGRVASALKRVLSGARRGSSGVLLEITAGQGHSLGARFEELGDIIEQAGGSGRIGVCFDTCHALAAGHEFRDAASYRETMRALDAAVGLSRLKAFHLNDSKGELGSRLDRHEHIGRGKVGLEAFRLILADGRFRDLPMVLETPKEDDLAEDRENLGVLLSLVTR